MQSLYRRLSQIGFDSRFVRARMLPDWWDDSLAQVPANRALAEAAISRMLGLKIKDLRDPEASLTLPSISAFRLKQRRGSRPTETLAALVLAQRIAAAVAQALGDVPPFRRTRGADQMRNAILARYEFVDLDSLLDEAWRRGVAVIHMAELPRGSKKFDGMAMFCGKTPVIVLASGRDGPAWLAFHLAHELAHMMAGHVKTGQRPLVDGDLDRISTDDDERQANRFACKLLTGFGELAADAVYGMTGERLARTAREVGGKYKIDPGAVALIYGRQAERMGVAQRALQQMGVDRGAHERVAAALEIRLREDLPESTRRLLSLATESR